MRYPKISIVTPSFNQGKYLEQTILSVINQNYPNLEYIIIDGGSTDNSVEIIKKYEKYLAYWVSEKDKGQSHAINKGLNKITGEIFNWLCSDDYLEQGSLFHISQIFLKNKNIHCYAGRLRQFSERGTIGYYENMLMPEWEDTLRIRVLKQPSVYFSKHAVEKIGLLNENLHYCMDAEWLYKFLFLFKEENIFEDDYLIAHYFLHENSKSGNQTGGFIKENDTIIHSFAKLRNLNEYVKLLERNDLMSDYSFPENILANIDLKTLEHMIYYYVLRRAVKIYSEKDFEFSKQFLSIRPSFGNIKPDEKKMLDFLDKNVKGSSWLMFKLKRAYLWRVKKKHLSFE